MNGTVRVVIEVVRLPIRQRVPLPKRKNSRVALVDRVMATATATVTEMGAEMEMGAVAVRVVSIHLVCKMRMAMVSWMVIPITTANVTFVVALVAPGMAVVGMATVTVKNTLIPTCAPVMATVKKTI